MSDYMGIVGQGLGDENATTAGNAPVDDMEGTRENNPSPPAVVVYRTFQAGGWFYAPFALYAGYRGAWMPTDDKALTELRARLEGEVGLAPVLADRVMRTLGLKAES